MRPTTRYLLATLGVAGVFLLGAQSPGGLNGTPRDDDRAKRPRHQRALTKVRPGSFLRREPPIEAPPTSDRRGVLEQHRDFQVVIHYQRMARLDVIAEIAAAQRDQRLADRVESVRREERDRFRQAMRRLRTLSRGRLLLGQR